jgi:glucose-1-phosphate thymidylyltransferase
MSNPITDKAVILARGLGTRMRKAVDGASGLDEKQTAAADTGVKALIPIDRPFLDYVLSALGDAGYRKICLVIGPDHDAIRNYYGDEVELDRLSIEFAVQEEPIGTANAVAAAEQFAAGEPIAVLNSDNYYPVSALKGLREHGGAGIGLFHWQAMMNGNNLSEERLRAFAVADLDEDGCLNQFIEKPDEATWNALPRPIWISMNCWQLPASIFDACKAIEPSARGEYELPDAVSYSMDKLGERYRAIKVDETVLDMTCREDIARVAGVLAGSEVRL